LWWRRQRCGFGAALLGGLGSPRLAVGRRLLLGFEAGTGCRAAFRFTGLALAHILLVLAHMLGLLGSALLRLLRTLRLRGFDIGRRLGDARLA
jgi:hypothetical protein